MKLYPDRSRWIVNTALPAVCRVGSISLAIASSRWMGGAHCHKIIVCHWANIGATQGH